MIRITIKEVIFDNISVGTLKMIWLYLLSLAAGGILGMTHALAFYRRNKQFDERQVVGTRYILRSLWLFFIRYVLLFAAFWVIFLKCQLNIYVGIAGFFVAFWGVLLKNLKGSP